ncbi:lamin tail domain-containing protein, partial [candidate division WOR-3 bacterium]|nr:lamin tail domain-containing protein [candidate division WOR-3 bacterium]
MIRKCAYIIVCTLLFASPSILLSANLANNPGFENWTGGNPDDWSSDNKIILSQETDTIHGGSYSTQVVCTTQNQSETDFWHTSQISVTEGQDYSFTAWVYDNDIAGRVRLCIQYNTGILYTAIYSDTNSNWQQLSYVWTAPTGATWAKPTLRFYDVVGNWDGDAVFYIDDVYFSTYPSTDSGNVVINEIMYNPSLTQGSDANFEWIELWNIDSDTMDISGWTVSDVGDTFDIPGGAVVPPMHFLIIP